MLAESDRDSSPYKRLESYQVEDGPLFFGRTAVSAHLLNCILANRLTVLHAPSGAGKSSLLNAAIQPGLERKGWLAVRSTPGMDPLAAVRDALVSALVPSPDSEATAVERALSLLGDGPLALIVARATAVKEHLVQEWRGLVRPVDSEAPAVRPYITRMLAGTIEIERLNEHHGQILAAPGVDHVTGSTSLRELQKTVGGAAYRDGQSWMAAQLRESHQGLVELMQTALRVYRPPTCELRIALIFDQFEELFTRFIDSPTGAPATDAPDWRLRPRFFEQLADLYSSAVANVEEPELGSIRFLVSVRDDYVGRTEPLKRIAPEVSDNYFRLSYLTEPEARQAIEQPAARFDVNWESSCVDAMVADLLWEDSFVDPTQLQIVCHKLWESRTEKVIPRKALTDAEEVRGIIAGFFAKSLAEVAADADERLEALDIFSLLVTGERTRNIVPRSTLIGGPYRDVVLRRRLLDAFIARRLLRAELKGSEDYVEVMHEFLIAPLQKELTTGGAAGLPALRRALERMAAMEAGDSSDNREFLRDDWQQIHEAARRLRLSSWAVEVMFRETLRAAHGEHEREREKIVAWLRRLEHQSPNVEWLIRPSPQTPLGPRVPLEARLRSLSKGELHALGNIAEQRVDALRLTEQQRSLLIDRAVRVSGAGDRQVLGAVVARFA